MAGDSGEGATHERIVRHEVLHRGGPEFEVLVNQVSGQMTTTRVRQVNARVAAGIDVSTVAREWTSSHDVTP
jgi:glycine betaine/choline ABC-type transport system substrate-binding protein